MSLTTFTHTPGASRVYRLVWQEAAEDPIVSETFAIDPDGPDMTIEAAGSSGIDRQFRATGGIAGASYVVTHAVVFSSGDLDSRTVTIQCVTR